MVTDDTDKLKLRSEPKVSPDTVMTELNNSTRLEIVGGFVCVHSDETGDSYWFWQVEVISTGEIGWVAEGDASHYFLEPLALVAAPTTAVCTDAVTRVSIGQQVTVVTDDTDKLKLRNSPVMSPDTVVGELDKSTKLKILDGPVCAYSEETAIYYWLWKVVVLSNGKTGWVAEGDFFRYFIE